jgi:hypothetical protein
MKLESIRLLPDNKPENRANRCEQCGAIEQPSSRENSHGFPDKAIGEKTASALASLETPLRFINDVDAAFPPYKAVVAMAAT